MAAGAGRGSLVIAANKLESISFHGFHGSPNHLQRRLSASKPSWVVRTESNVRKEQRKKPDPPCIVCEGSGRVKCYNCQGRGRTNFAHLATLPKGEWPKWCNTCGGSGLGYCSRCLGTGEYRDIMGFRFMKTDNNRVKVSKQDLKWLASNGGPNGTVGLHCLASNGGPMELLASTALLPMEAPWNCWPPLPCFQWRPKANLLELCALIGTHQANSRVIRE
ncbi:hypothetical protein NE237_027201 [Protea cynaroides]|uniref:Uncharacterized protein n=1 Tax=Protea cynaroides TaxID=273540 RepID=A0A9Q0GN41_9MAGN|nr:hypothetical protein NE237_027201 [Protea cynaroides]